MLGFIRGGKSNLLNLNCLTHFEDPRRLLWPTTSTGSFTPPRPPFSCPICCRSGWWCVPFRNNDYRYIAVDKEDKTDDDDDGSKLQSCLCAATSSETCIVCRWVGFFLPNRFLWRQRRRPVVCSSRPGHSATTPLDVVSLWNCSQIGPAVDCVWTGKKCNAEHFVLVFVVVRSSATKQLSGMGDKLRVDALLLPLLAWTGSQLICGLFPQLHCYIARWTDGGFIESKANEEWT